MTDIINEKLLNFFKSCPMKSYKKGEIIIFQGEAPRSAFAVKSGVVKAYNLSISGDEKPVKFHTINDAFPGSWIFGKVPSSIYYYEAFTPNVILYYFNKNDYIDLIKQDKELLFGELDRYVSDQLGTSMRLNALQHSRARDKLVYTLHYLTLSHGRQVKEQQMEIVLDLTHQDFANLTGLTRETTATELNKLKSLGVISYSKNSPYTLYLDKLMAMLNDEYISDLKITL